MCSGQHEIIIVSFCLTHSISGFRSSLCAVVLDGPRRFSLIWYLALLLWLSIVWFTLWYGWRVSVVIRPKFILTDIMLQCTHVRTENFALLPVGDLSSAYQTGDSTTDIRSNGSRKYQQARQKRKLIDASTNCVPLPDKGSEIVNLFKPK